MKQIHLVALVSIFCMLLHTNTSKALLLEQEDNKVYFDGTDITDKISNNTSPTTYLSNYIAQLSRACPPKEPTPSSKLLNIIKKALSSIRPQR